jgi:hypothetical protein
MVGSFGRFSSWQRVVSVDGVEQKLERRMRLAAVLRPKSEQHHTALSEWDVDHGRSISKVVRTEGPSAQEWIVALIAGNDGG